MSILGLNGVGKSTFMYCINKILAPTEGRVLLNGTDVQTIEYKDIAKNIAYGSQVSNETFSMTVMDTVLMRRYPHTGYSTTDKDLEITARCLEMTGVADLAMRNFDELSVGRHQKVMIARGLAQEPKILLLDEPTLNLDIYHQIHMMRMLRCITAEKSIIVMVICHDLNIVSRFSDRITMLAKGGVHTDRTSEEVMTPETTKRVYGGGPTSSRWTVDHT